ncbi:MAG: nitrilase-related carbon-nitrogen hydrolase, partial [Bacteroidota bacterium]
PLQIYTKQYLHQGEEDFYDASFAYNPILSLKGESIALAICADIDNPAHPAKAQANGVSLYVASIFFSEGGIAGGQQMLAQYAQQHQFSVLMANYCGEHWHSPAGGKSGFWDENGHLVASLAAKHPGLIIVEKQAQTWQLVKHPSSLSH